MGWHPSVRQSASLLYVVSYNVFVIHGKFKHYSPKKQILGNGDVPMQVMLQGMEHY